MGPQRRDSYKCRLGRLGDSGSTASSDSELYSKQSTKSTSKESEKFDRLFDKLSAMEKNSKKDMEELKAAAKFTSDKLDNFTKEFIKMKKMVTGLEKENAKLM